MSWRSRLLTGVLAVVSLLAGLGIAELVCRRLEGTGHAGRQGAVDGDDPAEGWRGIRRFGSMDSGRPRVLIVGDSFTAGRGVAEGEDYTSVLARTAHVEVFSYGAEGYSTAQELIVARRLLRRIRPDVVVLQMSVNDFINNSYALESRSLINNNLRMRPYFESGTMVHRYPRFGGRARAALQDRSALARRLYHGLDRGRGWLAVQGWLETVENEIAASGGRHQEFRRSVATTGALLRLLRDGVRPVPLLAFPADGVGLQKFLREEFAALCRELQVPFLDELPEAIHAADQPRHSVYIENDPHWSARGHAVAAAELGRWIPTFLSQPAGLPPWRRDE